MVVQAFGQRLAIAAISPLFFDHQKGFDMIFIY
jgi:hypothetical protein